jgi:hypothetical protein
MPVCVSLIIHTWVTCCAVTQWYHHVTGIFQLYYSLLSLLSHVWLVVEHSSLKSSTDVCVYHLIICVCLYEGKDLSLRRVKTSLFLFLLFSGLEHNLVHRSPVKMLTEQVNGQIDKRLPWRVFSFFPCSPQGLWPRGLYIFVESTAY